MSEAAAEATGEATAAEQQPQGADTGAAETKPAETKTAEWDGKIESLPADAQKIITDLRKEAGDERVASKTLAAIQKALNPDAKGEKPTAEALTQALTERDNDAKQARAELAVYKAATKLGADADALLDSRGFLAKLKDIDPSKTADVEKAIKEAVTANPKLKVVLAAGTSSANFGGPGESAPNASKARPGQARIAAAYASK